MIEGTIMKTRISQWPRLGSGLASKTRFASRQWLLGLLLLLTLPSALQAQFAYYANSGTITITGYTGPGGAVTIPGAINGWPVTTIGDYAFTRCTRLTSVTIPNSVTSIGYGAFSVCASLTSVTIPDSVTTIGDYAFYGCTSLMTITVDALNNAYGSVDGVLFNKGQTTLIQYPGGRAGSYTIPQSVTRIWGGWGGAFSGCTKLTSVAIGNSVTNVGDYAFSGCTSLATVTIGNSVPYIGDFAFSGCRSLTSATIGNSVTSIGDDAFSGCTNLTSVTIPNSVTSIGDGAFTGCTSLTSARIGNSVTSIGDGTFTGCTSLTSITIGNSVTDIWASAFNGCTGLTNVTIGNSVTYIGGSAFEGCASLNGVYFKGNAPSVDSSVFSGANQATVYYLPGMFGWRPTFGERPTMLWRPQMQSNGASAGVQTNGFGFTINWASGMVVVVETSTNLTNPIWSPLGTNTLASDSTYFSDPEWSNHPTRFYRLRSP
jgi:BspA type Leucine rich repeat region (6 copies)